MSPEDEAALAAFMSADPDAHHQRTLADTVLQRIREKQAEQGISVVPRCGARGGHAVRRGGGPRWLPPGGGGVPARKAVLVYGGGSPSWAIAS